MGYNVFADMGFENPEMELLKCQIVSSLRVLIVEKELTEEAVAALGNVPASEVPLLLHGDWEDYTVEQLFQFADAVNRNINVRRLIVNQTVAPDKEVRTLVLTA